MTTMTAAASPKLPLWRTIGQAYALWARSFPDLLRTVWVWMLVMAPVVAIMTWWQVPHLEEMMQAIVGLITRINFVDQRPVVFGTEAEG